MEEVWENLECDGEINNSNGDRRVQWAHILKLMNPFCLQVHFLFIRLYQIIDKRSYVGLRHRIMHVFRQLFRC
jgi:hypothetical protein